MARGRLRKDVLAAIVPAALLALPALAGCGGEGGGSQGGEPALGPVPAIRSGTTIELPLDAYTPEEGLLGKANDLLLQDCVRRYGFSMGSVPPARPRPKNERRYGIMDANLASRRGYSPPPETAAQDQKRQLAVPNPPPIEILYGRAKTLRREPIREFAGQPLPSGGCVGEARTKLSAGAPAGADFKLGMKLSTEAHGQAERDGRVIKAWAMWSSCMAKSGYRYKTPWHANNDPQWEGDAASLREIRTAQADISCRNSTNMVGVWVAVESAYQRRLIEKNGLALAETKKLIEIRQRNVASFMAGR